MMISITSTSTITTSISGNMISSIITGGTWGSPRRVSVRAFCALTHFRASSGISISISIISISSTIIDIHIHITNINIIIIIIQVLLSLFAS